MVAAKGGERQEKSQVAPLVWWVKRLLAEKGKGSGLDFLRSEEVQSEMMYPEKIGFIIAVCAKLADAVGDHREVTQKDALKMYPKLWKEARRQRESVLTGGIRPIALTLGGDCHVCTGRVLRFNRVKRGRESR